MKKLYLLAALLMTGTAAHAGNSISLEIGGHRVHIVAPRNCESLSCIRISAPGLSASDFGLKNLSFGGNSADDQNDAAPSQETPAQNSASTPVTQRAAPAAAVNEPPVLCRGEPPARFNGRCIDLTGAGFRGRCAEDTGSTGDLDRRAATGPRGHSARRGPDHAARPLGHRRKQRKRPRRTMRAGSVRLCREDRREDSDQHEAVECKMGRPDPRPEQRQELRLHDRDEGTKPHARSGLRLRRTVLRRPNLETGQLNRTH